MILAETVRSLVNMSRQDLSEALARSGYRDCKFTGSEFLGITNGGNFCYRVTFPDEYTPGQMAHIKVFVKFNPVDRAVTAEF